MSVRWERAKRRILRWLWDETVDGPWPSGAAPEAVPTPAPAPVPVATVTAPTPAPEPPRSTPASAVEPLPIEEIAVESTPNPHALRFSAGLRLVASGSRSWGGDVDHPVGKRLLAVPGVASVFVAGDFLTVTRQPDARWGDLTAQVQQIFAEEAPRAPWA